MKTCPNCSNSSLAHCLNQYAYSCLVCGHLQTGKHRAYWGYKQKEAKEGSLTIEDLNKVFNKLKNGIDEY